MQNNALLNWASTHPRLAAWIVLSVGMVVMLVYFGRDVGLTALNWTALVLATVGTAGLCIWIISWEDAEESEDSAEESHEDDSGAEAKESSEESAENDADASQDESEAAVAAVSDSADME